MRYNKLGRTGLFVSELCLGTMTFGGTGDVWSKIGGLQQGEADGLIRTAFDKGVNFLDSADVYSSGLSEEITGQAIKNLGLPRRDIVLATKAFGPMGDGQNTRGASRVTTCWRPSKPASSGCRPTISTSTRSTASTT